MRMIGADHRETLRLRLVDTAAASDLREVVDGRDFVAPGRIRRTVAAGNCFQYGRSLYVGAGFSRPFDFRRPTQSANQQSAALTWRITSRVRDNRRQRFA